jgi:hypothetical protein
VLGIDVSRDEQLSACLSQVSRRSLLADWDAEALRLFGVSFVLNIADARSLRPYAQSKLHLYVVRRNRYTTPLKPATIFPIRKLASVEAS